MGYRSTLIEIAGIALAMAREHDGCDENKEEFQWGMLMQEARYDARERSAKDSPPLTRAAMLQNRVRRVMEDAMDGRRTE